MAIKTKLIVSLLVAGIAGGGFYGYSVFAQQKQGSGTLVQAPLNIQANVKPAFLMAVDDSGSMTFQTMFPGADGEACWSDSAKSFFVGSRLRTGDDSTSQCNYLHVLPGPRISTGYYGIPPVDTFGFARSPDYNPSYFNPKVTYEPWLKQDLSSYGDASVSNTRIDPRSSETVKLFESSFDSSSRFRMRNGMFLPAGTHFWTNGTYYNAGSNGYVWAMGSRDAYFTYQPGAFYLVQKNDLPGYTRTGIARDACGDGCDMWRYEPQSAAAKQNFANWFSYYGNRNRAMVAGLTRALGDIRDMRVGYVTINGSKPSKLPMRDLTVQGDKSLLYADMLSLGASGGTPNRSAVNYLGQQFMRKDADAPIQSQCQKNSGMLFTDGYSNGSNPSPSVSAYSGLGVPFDPTPANSMAAIATKYYQTNLRPDLATGKVRVPEACSKLMAGSLEWRRLDCNKNLHMNFYGITLGARGKLFNSDLEQDPYTDSTIYGHWPSHQSNTPNTVDDIWHATVNTRGEFINARSPVDITDAMRRVLSSAGAGSTPSGSLGLTGARIAEGSFTVTPSYTARNESTDWYSTLLAQKVESDPITGEATYTKLWEASEKIPAAGSRNILVAKKGSGIRPSVGEFKTSNVKQKDFCTDAAARCTKKLIFNGKDGLNLGLPEAIAYLRGDQSNEVQNGGILRDRTTRLGDIVNSTPIVTSPFLDYGYRSLRTQSGQTYTYPFKDSYAVFLESKKTADKPMVYAGANDGMLHAFDGKTGKELFAYIPVTALGRMGDLLFPYNPADKQNQMFSHKYLVDGPLTVADAYSGGSWKTILVGTAGAGGRGIFALDVTNPGSFKASDVLWDINDPLGGPKKKKGGDSDDGDDDDDGQQPAPGKESAAAVEIGHVLGRPVIVPVIDNGSTSWKVIFGNGYGSENNDAVLFVVDVDASDDSGVKMIKAEEDGREAIANGLGNIIVLDEWIGDATGAAAQRGSDGFADTVYGADQNGAIWKFDLRDDSTDLVFVAKTGTAANSPRQPILGGLEAASGPGGGVMLYFGTGSFSFDGDNTDKQLQTFYGILDRPGRTGPIKRNDLAAQTITETDGERALTNSPLGGSSGWYIDLAANGVQKGERFVGYPRVESGVVFFTTYEPENTDDCASVGSNRMYGVHSLSGGSALSEVKFGSPDGVSPGANANGFTLDTGGSAPVKDVAVMSTPRLSPLSPTATAAEQAAALAARCSMVIQVAGAPPMYMPRQCGRQSWRQVR